MDQLPFDSGSLLRSLLAASGDCIKILDLDGNLLFMTEGGQRLMEVADFNSIKGCPWPEFWQGQGNVDAKAAIATAKAGGFAQFQGFATTMAGTPKWWEVSVTPIFGPDGKPERLLSVSRDITAQRLTAKARDSSEQQLRLALAAGRLGHWSLDFATGVMTASAICKENFGRDPAADFTYEQLRDAIHPDDRARMIAAVEHTRATGEDYDIEYHVIRPDGTTGWVMIRGQLIGDQWGKPVGMSGVSLDIGMLKGAEQALIESETRFKTFAQVMPNQVWSATPDGQLDWFNDQVYEYSGLEFADLKGNGWAQIVHPGDIGGAAEKWAKALKTAELYQTEFRLRRADGSWRWHLARALPISGQDGTVTRWVGSNTDIEDQKRSEDRQKLLSRELEHRIKNTLAMVGAIASQTFRTAATKEDARTIFDARLSALNHAHEILTSTSWTSASMSAVVQGALAPHRSGEGRIKIDGPEVDLTARQALSLALALHELATNATKYGALSVPGGTIGVSWDCRRDGESRRLRFEWRESGGPAVQPPTRRGFGSRLIERTLSSDFDGSVSMDFRPEGLVCHFETTLGGGAPASGRQAS